MSAFYHPEAIKTKSHHSIFGDSKYVFLYFQKNLEFLHTDEIIRWYNYAGFFTDEGSSNRKVKYGREGQVENQECTLVFLSPKIFL